MKKIKILFSLLVLSLTIISNAQDKPTYNVAIVVYEGVELFDFAGPGEVFAAARRSEVASFNVFTVAPSMDPVVSQTFLSINPNYSIENAPDIDIIIIPGGNTNTLLSDESFLAWTKELFPKLTNFMSVCNGAYIPARIGILDGLTATTHYSAMNGLRDGYPNVEVVDEKFVDNGKIITAGGVSSGTEGSLHMIRRLAGLSAARQVARYMEYDHWDENTGRIAYEHPDIEKLNNLIQSINDGDGLAIDHSKFDQTLEDIKPGNIDYGQLESLGNELMDRKQYELAAKVFLRLAELFPWASSPYSNLSEAYQAGGKETPLSQSAFMQILRDEGVENAVKQYKEILRKFPGWKIFSEGNMNFLGYRYLSSNREEEAVKIFMLNTLAYPNSFNAWDSYGEGLMRIGKMKEAVSSYEKSLELNPENSNAEQMIKRIKASGK